MALPNGGKDFLIINSMHAPFKMLSLRNRENKKIIDTYWLLSSYKGNQTETIKEFNKWFNRIVQKSPCKY